MVVGLPQQSSLLFPSLLEFPLPGVPIRSAKAAAPAVDPWAPTFAYDHNVVVANKRQYMALLAGSSDLFTAHSTFRNAARVAHRPPRSTLTDWMAIMNRRRSPR